MTKWILGIRPGFSGLTFDPCIPPTWDGFTVTRQWCGARYAITVENSNHVSKGVRSISVNGRSLTGDVPIQAPGTSNTLTVVLG